MSMALYILGFVSIVCLLIAYVNYNHTKIRLAEIERGS